MWYDTHICMCTLGSLSRQPQSFVDYHHFVANLVHTSHSHTIKLQTSYFLTNAVEAESVELYYGHQDY